MSTIISRPVVGAPRSTIAERKFAARMLDEHGPYDDWCDDTRAAYLAGIAAIRSAETPVITLRKAQGGEGR